MTPMPGWERSPAFVFDAARCTLSVLDQAHLPFEQRYLQPASVADCARVIRDMNVRGAPLIGLVAAAGMAFAARADASDAALAAAAALLIGSRPTAVNLRWAVQDVQAFQAVGFRQVDLDLNLLGPDLNELQRFANGVNYFF